MSYGNTSYHKEGAMDYNFIRVIYAALVSLLSSLGIEPHITICIKEDEHHEQHHSKEKSIEILPIIDNQEDDFVDIDLQT